jgi:hypothetical protein
MHIYNLNVNKALDQSLFRKNIKNKFKGTWIWPLTAKLMDDGKNIIRNQLCLYMK